MKTTAATVPARRVKLTWASAIEPEPVRWAWEDRGEGRIPAGSLVVAAGRRDHVIRDERVDDARIAERAGESEVVDLRARGTAR